MAKVKYKVNGLKKTQRNILSMIKFMPDDARKGVALAAQKVKTDSMDMTSIDTGELIESAYMIEASVQKERPAAIVGYSDDKAKYVQAMSKETNWQRAGAQNWFLYRSLNKNLINIGNTITRIIKRGLKRRSGK